MSNKSRICQGYAPAYVYTAGGGGGGKFDMPKKKKTEKRFKLGKKKKL